MTFGTELRQAREAQGLSIAEVSARTKIRGDYLQALEDGNLAALPERPFVRSYLQRYARELHLELSPLLADFDRTLPAAPEIAQSLRASRARPPAGARSGGTAARRPDPRAGLLALGLTGLVVVGALGYYAYRTWGAPAPAPVATPAPAPSPAAPAPAANPTPAPATTVPLSVSSVPAGAQVFLDNRDLGQAPVRSFPVQARRQAELRVTYPGREPLKLIVQLDRGRNLRAVLSPSGQASTLLDLNDPAASQRGQAPATPAPNSAAPSPATAQSAVRVSFTAPSWTRVTDAGGRVLYEGTPAVGTVKGFPSGVTVRAGNAGAVQVSVRGAPAQAMGQTGQVVTRTY